ncbi:MAG: M48 family metallopeptidase [Verrucomicrobiota bacterium]|nr:M48 family metallopeptidase [Verrucomicrobiota bacterium]
MIKQWISLRFVLALVLVLPSAARPQQAPSPPPAARISVENAHSFDPAAATKAWLDTVSPEKRAKSDAYFEGGYWLILWNFLLTVAVMLFLLASGISARLRDFAERNTRFKSLQVGIYVVGFLLLSYLLQFPLIVYELFLREHAYGMATQNFAQWFGEQMLALFVVQLPLSVAALMGLYAAFRRVPRTWWIWVPGIGVIFAAILFTLGPVFIEPLFNTYKPLTDPAIKESILAMARANEIPVDQVFEVDASRQTKRISANVAGFMGTTRIALNDNLLKQCSLLEIREVMAHEMGHFVLNHTMKLLLQLAVLIFLCFVILQATFDWALRRWGTAWNVRGISDPAGFPLIVLIFATILFLLTPVINTISRVTEREADAFGINASRESDGMAAVALKLGAYRKLNPGPIEECIFYDHPSGRARIRMAMDWKAAQLPPGDVKTTPQ